MSAQSVRPQRFGWSALLVLLLVVTTARASHATTLLRPATMPLRAPTASITLIPVADAYIDSFQPASTFGLEPELQVTNIATVAVIKRASLLRFDLSVLPSGSLINRAELRLHQTNASGSDWHIDLNRTITAWQEDAVTWNTRPFTTSVYTDLPVPNPGEPTAVWDVTDLVRSWAYGVEPNLGLELAGNEGLSFSRSFDSREGANAPELFIEYSPPPTNLVIAEDLSPVKLDGQCDLNQEYAKASAIQFVDTNGGLATVYLKHDAQNIYLCFDAQPTTYPPRFIAVYLDTDFGREKYATADDYALQVNIPTGQTSSQVGTGDPNGVYTPAILDNWNAAASANDGAADTAEFVIARKLFNRTCTSPFGLAFFHRNTRDQNVDYGLPADGAYELPDQSLEATLENPGCIRVCSLTAVPCGPAPTATLRDADTGASYPLDSDGFVLNRDQIPNGAHLWALMPISGTASSKLYYTSGDRQAVTAAAFQGASAGIMTLVVSAQHPLLVQDLTASAQWWVEGDAQHAQWLRDSITHAADFLYQFTDGQFTLGKVTVYQSYDHWDNADLKLHINNVLQPKANIGGIVPTDTVDISPTVSITYSPGSMYMGSYWNRFGAPPGQVVHENGTIVPTTTMQLDWSLALAHELSHYLLFLFDTYTGVDGKASQELAERCTGSAMGDVYKPSNQAYIYSYEEWQTNCNQTEAYHTLGGRTEWETIHLWYPWTITPTGFVSGPVLPAGLTQVAFVPPTTQPGPLASNQLFDLAYQDNETNSGEALGFILRNDRVFEQGKPAKGSNQIQLIDAQIGDRFCVYDVNDHAEDADTPRHQFGCELIREGDATLEMTKDDGWAPLVDLRQTGSNQLSLTVTQAISAPVGIPLQATLYQENGPKLMDLTLTGAGDIHTGTFNLAGYVPPVYLQLYISETVTAPTSRREVMANRGTGGSGAFGPARHLGGVLVESSDGNASYQSDVPLDLQAGQSIAWQSMPGTPPLPPDKTIHGQSYRLDAFPASLVVSGTVEIEYQGSATPMQAAGVGQNGVGNVALYFWDGIRWQVLQTTIVTPVNAADGVHLVSAPSRGIGVYAVLENNDANKIYLPMIRQ